MDKNLFGGLTAFLTASAHAYRGKASYLRTGYKTDKDNMPTNVANSYTIAPAELWKRMGSGSRIQIIDVREADEYEDWHIQGSVNVPGSTLGGAPVQKIISKDKEVITVCAHGIRSEMARRMLEAYGYMAKTMEGGMVAWNGVYDVVQVPCPLKAVTVLQLRRVGKGCLSYVIISGGKAAVIDPAIDAEAYIEAAGSSKITVLLETHAHADHVSGGTDISVSEHASYCSPDEVSVKHICMKDGSEMQVEGARIRAMATPGHTPGSLTYLLGNLAFTGDSLFIESVGRPDLGQNPLAHSPILWESIHNILLRLPEDTLILPSHYGEGVKLERGKPVAATVAELGKKLKALSFSKAQFTEWIASNAAPKPGNFETIKKINTGRMPMPSLEEIRELEAGPNRCAVSS